ncbi:MAG: IclR family transcriptional regulator [Spirochaetales bacterium]|nr:IclR family transcriptional regulator [Spirochaetales bacterium]
MAKEEKTVVQSVDRALQIVSLIAENPQSNWGLQELSSEIGIDKSSVSRSINTLAKYGLIRQDTGERNYHLGFGVFKLASILRNSLKITEIVSPFLKQMKYKWGENTHLAVRSGNRCVFIDRELGSRALTANTNIGDTEELYCTAVGKSLIMDMTAGEMRRLIPSESLQPFTENTITSLDELVKELNSCREKGYTVDREEFEPNVVCLAAPIRNYKSEIEAAIGISGPKLRIEPALEELGRELAETAAQISSRLGYSS